ncbi:hypothetical protein Taro_034520 [Colocasia esculenta]|uniref:RING-type domain-containing protein n=1 Tax=Colocasia esculenta TaxID=4460 RepID=A0A843VRL5_COLES|nr:hypothetical protein [Colocasia esculenta]
MVRGVEAHEQRRGASERMEAAGMRRRGARGGGSNRWKSLKRRLGCCGSSWAFLGSSPDHWVREDEAAEGARVAVEVEPETAEGAGGPGCDGEIREAASPEAMNLAAALAAERQFRAASAHPPPRRDQLDEGSHRWEGEREREGGTGTPVRASLMRLLAEGAGGDADEAWWCCVCMGRRRGAAFIPCGHTLCRVCSRDVWLNRGACPLCNRPILDVLDIF